MLLTWTSVLLHTFTWIHAKTARCDGPAWSSRLIEPWLDNLDEIFSFTYFRFLYNRKQQMHEGETEPYFLSVETMEFYYSIINCLMWASLVPDRHIWIERQSIIIIIASWSARGWSSFSIHLPSALLAICPA